MVYILLQVFLTRDRERYFLFHECGFKWCDRPEYPGTGMGKEAVMAGADVG